MIGPRRCLLSGKVGHGWEHTFRPVRAFQDDMSVVPLEATLTPLVAAQVLAHNAVHAAFAGYTGVTVRPRADRAQGLPPVRLACVAARGT